MRYPLDLRFKLAAIASQIYVTDADGNNVFYIKQKLFKLKENIEIFTDGSKTQKLYTVKADRVIDFSPEFTLYDPNESPLGSVKRHGRKSIWKSTYDIKIGNMLELKVTEHDPWVKVADALISEIPVVGLISGYILHPRYDVTDSNGNIIAKLDKKPAFLEGRYGLDATAASLDENTSRTFSALMMVVVLRERLRG
jgi:uncharacterized protein YxjI